METQHIKGVEYLGVFFCIYLNFNCPGSASPSNGPADAVFTTRGQNITTAQGVHKFSTNIWANDLKNLKYETHWQCI